MSDILDRMAFGPLESLLVMDASAALGTTSILVALPALPVGSAPTSGILVKLFNGSTTATIAWRDVVRADDGSSVNPNITAGFVAATCGSHVGPGLSEWFVLKPDRDLYIVASAVSTSWSCSSRLFQ